MIATGKGRKFILFYDDDFSIAKGIAQNATSSQQ